MTMPGDLLSGALTEIARDLREKRVTARELIEAAFARHERFGERLHAYSLWAPEQARAVAAAADAAFSAGVTVGPLQGLPVSIKDLFAAAGYPCFAGSSRRLPADPWERDGPLVATLRRQLGVITGKTHMVEFASPAQSTVSAVPKRISAGLGRGGPVDCPPFADHISPMAYRQVQTFWPKAGRRRRPQSPA